MDNQNELHNVQLRKNNLWLSFRWESKQSEANMSVKYILKRTKSKPTIDKDSINVEDEVKESKHETYFVPPPPRRLIIKRNGHSITRQIPKPVALIDTREKSPFDFTRFPKWIAEERRQKLDVGDYSVQGMEDLLVLERKTLTDLITTLMQQRSRFFKLCEKLAQYRWRALFVEASYEDIKSPYGEYTKAHPNAVSGTLDALEARFGIPVVYTSCYRALAEEKAASWLSKHFTYWYLESNGFGRVLQEGDL
jgi:ERCC4-type nuclease